LGLDNHWKSTESLTATMDHQPLDLLKPLTLTESRRRWQVLLERQEQVQSWMDRCPPRRRKWNEEDGNKDRDADKTTSPFDLQSSAIPPLHTLVEDVLEDFCRQWKQLDFRKIQLEPNTPASPAELDTDDERHDGNPSSSKRRKTEGHYNNNRQQRLKIPERFDYETRRETPPSDASVNLLHDNHGSRVLNLLDPNQSTPYEQALWELFEQVPTLEDLQAQLMQGHQMNRTENIMKEIAQGYQIYTRMDAHALSQLRMKERHDMPPPTGHQEEKKQRACTAKHLVSTIRFECWRSEPKRGPASDPDRAIFEFQGQQTLADLHHTIVELTEDGLWDSSPSTQCDRYPDNSQNDCDASGDVSLEEEMPAELTCTDNHTPEPDSGYFFIEDTFYTIGSVDYVTPILKWLDTASSNARKSYLGIKSDVTLQIKPMAKVKLEEVPFRLGVRYHHACHGDVECAIFVTDRHHDSNHQHRVARGNRHKWQIKPVYPLVHDIWTASYASVDCEGCQKFPVSVATSNHCTIAQGHRLLCRECCQLLLGDCSGSRSSSRTPQLEVTTEVAQQNQPLQAENYDEQTHLAFKQVQPYPVWKNQPVLSTGARKSQQF
jgi:snRNA-activating protein complex (SNAPc), subunit 3